LSVPVLCLLQQQTENLQNNELTFNFVSHFKNRDTIISDTEYRLW